MMEFFNQFAYLIPFILATFTFGFIPGPSILYLVAQTISHGKTIGYKAAFGIHIGCFVHIFAGAFGLTIIFEMVPTLYTILKYAGVAYLIYLGFRLMQNDDKAMLEQNEVKKPSSFFQSMLVEILNPKTALFYIAFLPQFIRPEMGMAVWLQFIILGQFINLAFTIADIVYITSADMVLKKFKNNNSSGGIFRKIGGFLLMVLAGHIAFE